MGEQYRDIVRMDHAEVAVNGFRRVEVISPRSRAIKRAHEFESDIRRFTHSRHRDAAATGMQNLNRKGK